MVVFWHLVDKGGRFLGLSEVDMVIKEAGILRSGAFVIIVISHGRDQLFDWSGGVGGMEDDKWYTDTRRGILRFRDFAIDSVGGACVLRISLVLFFRVYIRHSYDTRQPSLDRFTELGGKYIYYISKSVRR